MRKIDITGNLINAYFVCHRQLWFFAHQIAADIENTDLNIGKLIAEKSYKRKKKEIQFGNIKMDLIEEQNNKIIVSEVKKSSKNIKAAKMQLLYYLYQLKQKGINAKGQLLIPKEKKKIEIQLTENEEKELIDTINKIKLIIENELPKEYKKISFCKKCSFFEFCWS